MYVKPWKPTQRWNDTQARIGAEDRANTPKPASGVLNDYANYQQTQSPTPTTTPTGIASAIDYTKGLRTAYTPDQELAMRNRIRATDTAQTQGGTQRIAEIMAARGLGGSGTEVGAMGDLIRGQSATRQSALSNLDINNATLGLQNQYNKANMLNQLTGMGEGARQYDIGQGNNMFQWGKQFDWNKAMDVNTQNEYQKQLQLLYQQLGLPYSTGKVGIGGSTTSSGGGGLGGR